MLALYLFSVIWITVICRSISTYEAHLEPFWSYRGWLAGNSELGREILGNIVMFIPLGFLVSLLFSRHRMVYTLCFAFLFSIVIEMLQFVLMRGIFEFDDLFNNIMGAVIGRGLLGRLAQLAGERRNRAVFYACAVIGVSCVVVAAGYPRSDADMSSRAFCFQVDKVKNDNGTIELEGFAFRYSFSGEKVTLFLKSTANGKTAELNTEQKKRTDVNDYFLCEQDYSDTGFTAVGETEPEEEYEVLVRFPWTVPIPTGVYITGDRVHYTREKDFRAPESLEEITGKGNLRVYRPEEHCWVYQVGNALYWIADEGFFFEEDGTTFIQYHLYTTQEDRLPQERLAHGWLWDNIGDNFEDYEIHGDFGPYRIMKRELPMEYAVTSVMTGYYKKGKWFWKSCFRPIYSFIE